MFQGLRSTIYDGIGFLVEPQNICYECETPPQLCTLMERFPGIHINVASNLEKENSLVEGQSAELLFMVIVQN